MQQTLFDTIVFNLFPLFFAIVFHEISHGLVAYSLGDDTAKRAGRFKLWTHFDLWGSFLIPLGLYLVHSPFLIGYAKPVPVDPRKFKDPLVDMALVAIAGPLYNLTVGVICALALQNYSDNGFIFRMLLNFTMINLGLFFFNLIPIPPLDGSRIVAAIIPERYVGKFYQWEPFGFFIIVGLEYVSNALSNLIGYNIGLFHLCVETPMRGILRYLLT